MRRASVQEFTGQMSPRSMSQGVPVHWVGGHVIESISETEDGRASHFEKAEGDYEMWELRVTMKKYRKVSGSDPSRCAMYEAVVECVHPRVRASVSARVGHGLSSMVLGLFHGWNQWCPIQL